MYLVHKLILNYMYFFFIYYTLQNKLFKLYELIPFYILNLQA